MEVIGKYTLDNQLIKRLTKKVTLNIINENEYRYRKIINFICLRIIMYIFKVIAINYIKNNVEILAIESEEINFDTQITSCVKKKILKIIVFATKEV
jgi:hypothetical protein